MASLPILLLGGAALIVVPYVHNVYQKDVTDPNSENTMEGQHVAIMNEVGASATAWANANQKQHLMGAPPPNVKGIHFYDPDSQGWQSNPGVDPLQPIWQEHAELQKFDQRSVVEALVAQRGEVRARRHMPIAAALTPEIHHPNHPDMRSGILETSYMPHNMNEAQIAQVQRIRGKEDPAHPFRREPGIEFFNRAEGQSFRYSE